MKRILFLFFVFLSLESIYAQEMTFIGSANPNPVAEGQRFNVSFKLTNARAKINPPNLNGLKVIFGPSVSESSIYINGKYSSSIEVSFIVIAEKEGKYTIDRAKAYTDKGVLETDPFVVHVTKNPYSNGTSEVPSNSKQSGDIILSIVPNKTSAFIGEPITLTYYLYSRYERLELVKNDFPNLPGFWTEEIKQENTSWETQLATINGQSYKVAVLKRQVIFPQKAGNVSIKPFGAECVVNRSFFSVGNTFSLKSNTLNLSIKPYPNNSPPNFSNNSGSFTMNCTWSAKQVKANEPLTLKVRISGNGNLKILNSPIVDLPADFEKYDPKLNDQIKLSGGTLTGYREFEYLLIPRYKGEYQIPPIQFSYFDLNSKRYQSLSCPATTIKVDKGSETSTMAVKSSKQQDIKLLNNDIRFIYTGSLPLQSESFWNPLGIRYWLISLGTLIIFALIIYFYRKEKTLRKDQKRYRASLAKKQADQNIETATRALNKNDLGDFYNHCAKAIYTYLSYKFGLTNDQLQRELLREKLISLKLAQNTVKQVLELLDYCEMARFSPLSAISPSELLAQTKSLLDQVEELSKNSQ